MHEFEEDWLAALQSADPRWFVYPDPAADDQVSIAEWVKAQQVLDLLAANSVAGGRILEYGCGSAGMSVFMKQRGFQTYALDRSLPALCVATLNDRQHDPAGPPLRCVVGDAARLPFPPGSFDVVMSYGLLEHFGAAELDILLKEVVGALRPGGLFIADIVPGRWNARGVATLVNFSASALLQLARGRWSNVVARRDHYFHHYFESALGPLEWERVLSRHRLSAVRVQVCRPFPPLAISGLPERLYVGLMRRSLPFWRTFDASGSRFARRWGWMYLVSGVLTQ